MILPRSSLSTAAAVVLLFLPSPAPAGTEDPSSSAPERRPGKKPPEEMDAGTAPDPGEPPLLSSAELVLRGERLLDEPGKISIGDAWDLFKAALVVEPYNGAAFAGMARATAIKYSRRWDEDDGLVDRALDLARKGVIASPDDARSHAALAAIALIAEDGDTAYDEADRAWSLKNAATPAWVRETYAQSLIARGDHKSALSVLEELRPTQPGRYQTWFLEGTAHLEMGDLDEAVLCFRRANLLAPEFPAALLLMARVYDRMGRRDYASQLYARVKTGFAEESGRVLVLMSASLVGRHKYAEAMEGLDKIRFHTKRGLGEGTTIYLRALCLDKLGRTEEAIPLYRKVTEEFPAASYGAVTSENLASAAYEALARIELDRGRQEEAVRLMEEALSKPRPTLSLFTRLASVYSEYKLHAEAVRVLKRAGEIDFGPRRAGLKATIYVVWARESKALTRGVLPPQDLLEALDRDAGAIRARGDIADFLEAARACALAGDNGRALSWMKLAVDRGYRRLDWVSGDAEMASLASDKGFDDLRRNLPIP